MDAAFATGKYPAYTTAQLKDFVVIAKGNGTSVEVIGAMVREIGRRAAVEAGDVSQMTAGERLRRVRTGS